MLYLLFLFDRRHVLRFLLQSPHGYHVEMASQTSFVYGDEDTVMACLTKVHVLQDHHTGPLFFFSSKIDHEIESVLFF